MTPTADDPLSFFLQDVESSVSTENGHFNSVNSEDECNLLAEQLLNAVVTEVETGEEATASFVINGFSVDEATVCDEGAVHVAVPDVAQVRQKEPGVEERVARPSSMKHPLEPMSNSVSASDPLTRQSSTSLPSAVKRSTSGNESSVGSSSHSTASFLNRGLESWKMAAASSSGVSSLFQKAASNLLTSQFGTTAERTTITPSGSFAEEEYANGSRPTVAPLPPSASASSLAAISSSPASAYTASSAPQQQQQLLSDPSIQAKLVSFAVGPLLKGERIIMFLSTVVNVATSCSPVTGVSSSALIRGVTGSKDHLWAVCMTFYRVMLINYTIEGLECLAMAPGVTTSGSNEVSDADAGDHRGKSEKDEEEFGSNVDSGNEMSNSTTSTPNMLRGHSVSSSSNRGATNNAVLHGLDNAISRAGLSRQWQYHHATSAYPSKSSDASTCLPSYQKHVVQMPLGSIDRVEKGEASGPGGSAGGTNSIMSSSGPQSASAQQTMVLYDKNGRWIRFSATSLGDAIRAHEALSTYAFPGKRNLGYLFAFEACREEVLDATQGGKLLRSKARFDAMKEFSRMGIIPDHQKQHEVSSSSPNEPHSSPWSVTMINANYGLCASYPSVLVVPHAAAEEMNGDRGARLIRQTASFRSESRLPVLAWGNGSDAASLWRCSQPKVGLGSNRNASDEFFIKSIAETAGRYIKGNKMSLPPAYSRLLTGAMDSDGDMLSFLHVGPLSSNTGTSAADSTIPPLRILDLRPKSSAMANRTQGYGYESTSNYPHCQLSFYNIANIHGVRDSYQKVVNLAQSPSTQDMQFSSLLESTGWLQMIRCILNASWQAAAVVNFHRLPVLLHCSHGWDRTSQVCALAQLFLDPYYRTMQGFAVLVEKEFCAFGHPFHTRCGHGEGGYAGEYSSGGVGGGGSSQRAPIFLQFLDCAWQLTNLFPSFFEFNGRYLLALSDHIYSCRFGTLLCDNERERVAAGVYERTNSLWDYLEEHRSLFANQRFNRVNNLLMPPLSCILRRVTLWSDYHLRYSPRAFLACLPRDLVPYVHHGWEKDGSQPEELRALQCGNDETDALLHKTQLELEECRKKCREQELELLQLRQALTQINGGEDKK